MPKELMIQRDTEETKPTELMLQIKKYTNTLYYSMLCVLLFFIFPVLPHSLYLNFSQLCKCVSRLS